MFSGKGKIRFRSREIAGDYRFNRETSRNLEGRKSEPRNTRNTRKGVWDQMDWMEMEVNRNRQSQTILSILLIRSGPPTASSPRFPPLT